MDTGQGALGFNENNMIYKLPIIFLSFFLAYIAILVLNPTAKKFGLIDLPSGRKRHNGAIPLIGGISIFISVVVCVFLFVGMSDLIKVLLAASFIMVFMGVTDDKYNISAKFRLVGQFVIASLFVLLLDLKVTNLGNLFWMGEVSVGLFGYPIALIAIVALTNAINMFDGIDGLAGCIGLINFFGLAILFFHPDKAIYMLCLAYIGATSAFLIFNIKGRIESRGVPKIFMGDAGSMLIGLTLSVLLIYGTQPPSVFFTPGVAIWFVILPLTDMASTMLRRIKKGVSPLKADRTHVHHIFLRAGFSTTLTLIMLAGLQLALVSIGLMLNMFEYREFYSYFFAICFIVLYQSLIGNAWRFIRWRKRVTFAG